MTTTQANGPTPAYFTAQVTSQREQLELIFHTEQEAPEYAHGAQQHNPTLRELERAGLLVWSPEAYYTTDRGYWHVLNLAEIDAYEERARREQTAATEVIAAVPADVEQTEIRPSEGTLPIVEQPAEGTLTGRHRIVRKSRWASVRDRLTVARVAVLSAAVGVFVGVGFMWLVTR